MYILRAGVGVGMKRKQNAVEYFTFTSLSGLLYNAELEYTGDAAFGGSYTYIEAVAIIARLVLHCHTLGIKYIGFLSRYFLPCL